MATTKTRNRIESVKFVREMDADADMSYLGAYSSRPGDDDKTIDRQERGDMGRNEFRYFVAANSAKETGNPESVEQDYQRAEALNRGDWCYMGVYAVAEVIIAGTVQKIRSGGLWGIESDSGRDYFEELRAEQLAELKEQLLAIGLSARAVRLALADCEDVDG